MKVPEKLWTWRGRFFGYRQDDHLYTHDGKCVGRFDGPAIFGRKGRYLGQLTRGRLVSDSRLDNRWGVRAAYFSGARVTRLASKQAFALAGTLREFPLAEHL